ncbi:hypothetical protein Tco_1217452 [Tanacetum coccineum]
MPRSLKLQMIQQSVRSLTTYIYPSTDDSPFSRSYASTSLTDPDDIIDHPVSQNVSSRPVSNPESVDPNAPTTDLTCERYTTGESLRSDDP